MMMHNAMVFTYYITLFLVCIMHVVSIISNNHIVWHVNIITKIDIKAYAYMLQQYIQIICITL